MSSIILLTFDVGKEAFIFWIFCDEAFDGTSNLTKKGY